MAAKPAKKTQQRPNQRHRTRKDLLDAASRLMRQGRQPSLEDVAKEAMVSRATAYRYFPSVEALVVESTLDVATPDPARLFANGKPEDPVARLQKVDESLEAMIAANEMGLRAMLATSLTRDAKGPTPRRQNRRTPLIEAALEPARKDFNPQSLDMLKKALALVIGTEAMVVFKDVLQLSDAEARKTRRWAIRALVEGARK